MGQKVNPNGIRLGINRTWSSRWFSNSEYSKLLHQDLEIKKFVEKKLKNASVSKVNIERAGKKLRISIYSSRPGIIIGKKGADIESLKKKLSTSVETKNETNTSYNTDSMIKKELIQENSVQENSQLSQNLNLENIWKKVLAMLELPSTKMLLSQQAKLVNLNSNSAEIYVS